MARSPVCAPAGDRTFTRAEPEPSRSIAAAGIDHRRFMSASDWLWARPEADRQDWGSTVPEAVVRSLMAGPFTQAPVASRQFFIGMNDPVLPSG